LAHFACLNLNHVDQFGQLAMQQLDRTLALDSNRYLQVLAIKLRRHVQRTEAETAMAHHAQDTLQDFGAELGTD